MFNIKLSDAKILALKADCYVFMLEEGFEFSKSLQEVAKEVFPKLQELFKHEAFTGKLMSSVTVPAMVHNKIANCVFIGVGKPGTAKKSIDIENFRRAIGA